MLKEAMSSGQNQIQSIFRKTVVAAAAKLLQSCPTLCDPIDGSQPGFPSLGFSRQEHWSGLPFPSPKHSCISFLFLRQQITTNIEAINNTNLVS